MSEFTPARTETISAYRDYRAAHPEGNLLTFVENLRATLATVRPNPDSPTQVEVVARAIHVDSLADPGGCVSDDFDICPYRRDHAATARAVLTALAAMGGER